MDVDCSAITYDTAASPGILSAAERAQAAMAGQSLVDAAALGRTESMQATSPWAIPPRRVYRTA